MLFVSPLTCSRAQSKPSTRAREQEGFEVFVWRTGDAAGLELPSLPNVYLSFFIEEKMNLNLSPCDF